MNFLEYFGVDTSKYEYLQLLTDFKIGTTNCDSLCKDGKQIYHFDLGFFNLNFDNKYISKLYKIFLYGRKNIKIQYGMSHFGSYLDVYGCKITINTDTNICGFHNSYFTEYEKCSTIIDMYHETSITNVMISKNATYLCYDKGNIYNDYDLFGLLNPNKIYTVDTTGPQSEVSKIEQKFKEEQESQGFVSAKTVFEAIKNSNKESNNMNFLEYFGVDTTKYSSLYLTTNFKIKAKDIINACPFYYYNLEIILPQDYDSNNVNLNQLYKFLTNNSNYLNLKNITVLYNEQCGFAYRIKCKEDAFAYRYISNRITLDYIRYGRKYKEFDTTTIKRVKITKSYIDLYFDDSKFKFDDDMLEVHFDQKPSICIGGIGDNGLKQISYAEYMEKSKEEKEAGSYLITDVLDNYPSHRFLDIMSKKLKDEIRNDILHDLEGPQVSTISNKENKKSMNMLRIESRVIDTNISSKNNRTYPSIILDSLPCSGITLSPFDIEEIKFRDKGGTTIVFWKDGTKTILKKQKGEKNDIEKVVAMAYMKKALSMMPTAKQRDMNNIITHAKVKYWQDVAEAKKIEEEKAKKAAKKKQKQEEAKLKEESKKKPTRRSSKK